MSSGGASGLFPTPAGRVGRLAVGIALYLGIGAVLAVLAFKAPAFVPAGAYPWLASVLVLAAAIVGAALVFGPSTWILGVFVLYMTASHMHNSIVVLPLGGIEWHPREPLLMLLLAHFGVRMAHFRVHLPHSPVHLFLGAFVLAWLAMAVTGLLRGNSMTYWVQESRYLIFLLAYPALLDLIDSREKLHLVLKLILGVAIVAAVGSLLLFLYMFLTGNIITNVQNYLGEYVRRQIGPFLLQSARPNAHQYFEIGSVVLTALFFAPGRARRTRFAILTVIGLFAVAIAITMMRTAFIATGLGLVLLAFFSLPRLARGPVILSGASVLLIGLVAFGTLLSGKIEQVLPELGVSLRARVVEIGGGLEVFEQHPLAGGGLGATFEAIGYVSKQTQQSYSQATYVMVHNVWLYYLFKGGLIAFFFALLGLGGISVYGLRLADRLKDPLDRALARGIAAAFAAQCVASLAMPRFNYPSGLIYIALTAVALIVLRYAGNKTLNDADTTSTTP